ncbi:MAG: Dynein light chain [Chaenotheca gracillima]|nr:MAG: Dynein light chain [Chaenotheca gracillima]
MAPLEDVMETSRIFVRGLPPNLSEADFRNYFSSKNAITDAKLIAHRRIGYVGYKSPADAAHAVKYFNRSYIRMSKLAVELAWPISANETAVGRGFPSQTPTKQTNDSDRLQSLRESSPRSLKRKRDEATQNPSNDSKLGAFLEVMKPRSKTTTWSNEDTPKSFDASMSESQPLVEEAKSLTRSGKSASPPRPTKASRSEQTTSSNGKISTPEVKHLPLQDEKEPAAVRIHEEAPQQERNEPEEGPELTAPASSDADWLRSRTSRLLGLVDDDEDAQPRQLPEESGDSRTELESTRHNAAEVVDGEDRGNPDLVTDPTEPEETQVTDENLAQIQQSSRLFVRNLPYTATEEDLRQHFSNFGELEEAHVPVSASGPNKGFAYLLFSDSAVAAQVYERENGKPFQGRLIHILPAKAKKEHKIDDYELSKLPLKRQKQIKRKAEASSAAFNWNSMYMNTDAVMSSVAEKLGVSKSSLLDPTSSDAAVKQAHAETHIISDTKQYFATNGVDLDAFKRRERGDRAILVKNFPHGTKTDELRTLFEQHGEVKRVLMPPNGIIAIVEFAQDVPARSAFANLAYRRFKDSVLFLEKAPKDLFKGNAMANVATSTDDSGKQPKLSGAEIMHGNTAQVSAESTTVFIRNLSFATTTERLSQQFRPLEGFLSARVKTKPDPKNSGKTLSMGFGFLEFRTKDQAQAAISTMNGHNLDGHSIVLRASHKGLDAGEERKKEDRAKKEAQKKTKVIIKNLPFEASKKDVRALFGAYGQLRSIRMPKKFDNTARGFAFADFVTVREAENAMNALKDTHLLGRRLVLDFAAEDPVDAEEEIEKMQKKVGGQVNKVALQRLTGSGRKKFNIEGGDTED